MRKIGFQNNNNIQPDLNQPSIGSGLSENPTVSGQLDKDTLLSSSVAPSSSVPKRGDAVHFQRHIKAYLQNLKQTARLQGAKVYEQEKDNSPQPIMFANNSESAARLGNLHFNRAFFQLSPYLGGEEQDAGETASLAAILNSIEQHQTPNQEVAQHIEEDRVYEFNAFIPESVRSSFNGNPGLKGMSHAARQLGYQTSLHLVPELVQSGKNEAQIASQLRDVLIQHLDSSRTQIGFFLNGKTLDSNNKEGAYFAAAGAYDPAADSVLLMAPAVEPRHFWVSLSSLCKALQPDAKLDKGWVVISKGQMDGEASAANFKKALPKTVDMAGRRVAILPQGLVKESLTRLTRAKRGSFDQINPFLSHQKRGTTSNITSACAVLNSFDPSGKARYTQENFLDEQTDLIKLRSDIVPVDSRTPYVAPSPGLDLNELSAMIVGKGFGTDMVHASGSEQKGMEDFRNTLKKTINNPNAHVIANFFGQAFNRSAGGQFSPIGAYDEKSDSVLIMDTASHHHENYFWVALADLYVNMKTWLNNEKQRGYLVVYNSIGQDRLEKLLEQEFTNAPETKKGFDLGAFLEKNGYPKNICGFHFGKSNEKLFQGMKLDGITFSSCTFNRNQLSAIEMSHCNFNHCVFQETSFMNSTLRNCSFEDCELKGSMFVNSSLSKTTLKNSKVQNGSFQYANIEDSFFINVRMPGTHFLCASVSNVSIDENSNLENTMLCGTDNGFDIAKKAHATLKMTMPAAAVLVAPEEAGISIPLVVRKIDEQAKIIPMYIAMRTPVVDPEKIDQEVDDFLNSAVRSSPASDASEKTFSRQLVEAIEGDYQTEGVKKFPHAGKIFDLAQEILKYAHSVVLPGGEDVPPTLYKEGREKKHEKTLWSGDYRRSLLELAQLHLAVQKNGVPWFVICRGFQMAALYFGAEKLHQHVGTQAGARKLSKDGKPSTEAQGIFGDFFDGADDDGIVVAIYHHQAVPAESKLKGVEPSYIHTLIDEEGKSVDVMYAFEPKAGYTPGFAVQTHSELKNSELIGERPELDSTENSEFVEFAQENELTTPARMLESGILRYMSPANKRIWRMFNEMTRSNFLKQKVQENLSSGLPVFSQLTSDNEANSSLLAAPAENIATDIRRKKHGYTADDLPRDRKGRFKKRKF